MTGKRWNPAFNSEWGKKPATREKILRQIITVDQEQRAPKRPQPSLPKLKCLEEPLES
jgi:hypothetical protein